MSFAFLPFLRNTSVHGAVPFQDQRQDPSRTAVAAGTCHALADQEGHRKGAAGLEDPALHLKLEKRQGQYTFVNVTIRISVSDFIPIKQPSASVSPYLTASAHCTVQLDTNLCVTHHCSATPPASQRGQSSVG